MIYVLIENLATHYEPIFVNKIKKQLNWLFYKKLISNKDYFNYNNLRFCDVQCHLAVAAGSVRRCKVTMSTTRQLLPLTVVVGHNFMCSFCLSFRNFIASRVNTYFIVFSLNMRPLRQCLRL